MTLSAERRRARAKREADILRQRARRVLSGRWNADAHDLLAAIAETYPELSRREMDRLVAVAREVQVDEAPRRIPVGSVVVRPLEIEPKAVYGTEGDRKAWGRIFGASLERRPVVRRTNHDGAD